MRWLLALAALVVPHAAAAQVTYPPIVGGDGGQAAQDAAAAKATADAAKLAADNAKSAADTATAAAAAACVPNAGVPPMEVVGGSTGSGNACRLANAIQPRISRTVSGTTAATGLGAVTWPAMPSVPRLTVQPYVTSTSAANAPLCFPVTGTVTTTGATIKCFSTQSVTVSLLGAVVAPITTAAAGITFDVLALPQS